MHFFWYCIPFSFAFRLFGKILRMLGYYFFIQPTPNGYPQSFTHFYILNPEGDVR